MLIPDDITWWHHWVIKASSQELALKEGRAAYQLVGEVMAHQGFWRVAGLRGRSATLGLRHCPDSYGRLQSRIFSNARKGDYATPRGGWRPSGCKLLSRGKKLYRLRDGKLTSPLKEATANSVPAAAVIQRVQTLFGITGLKAHVGGIVSVGWNPTAHPWNCPAYCDAWVW